MYAAGCIALLGIAAAIWWWRMLSAPPPAPGQPVPLTSYEGDQNSPDFSPDGSQVVFAWNGENRGKYHIFVKPVGSPNYLQLTKGHAEEIYPKWSPDGQWIAFQRRDDSGEHTFLMSPIGGNERNLRDGSCLGLSWSSDSKSLACGGESGLLLLSVENGKTRQLTSPAKGDLDAFPAFSPDGRNLLFMEGRVIGGAWDLYLLKLNRDLLPQALPRRITNEHAFAIGAIGAIVGNSVAWTADGREAIWSISKTQVYGTALFRIPVFVNGSVQQLAYIGRNVYSPAIARHRDRLAYVRWLFDVDIWRADGHTTERHPVSSTEIDQNPQFSPDGKRIAFESNRSGPEEVWVANSDGTDPVQLTNFGRHSGTPRWSPDGRWIAFDAYGADGRWQVWVVDSNGGTPRQLTKGPGGSITPSFSHDGKWIYFVNDRTGRYEVFRAPFGGGAALQITHSGARAPQELTDGKTVYYVRMPYALYKTRLADRQESSLGIQPAGLTFQVVPNGIYFIARTGEDGSGREIRFYNFATQGARVIQDLGKVLTANGLAVSPDGKTFLYSIAQDNGRNLMLVDNFRLRGRRSQPASRNERHVVGRGSAICKRCNLGFDGIENGCRGLPLLIA